MKKIKILLWLLIGGVILMTAASLNGCSLGGETIPKNRTKEQYEFEKTFEPIFKFLEQEKKDFTGLKAYICDVYIKVGEQVNDYEIDLDITESAIKGDYTITLGENKETTPVTYSNGKLNYGSELTPLFDEEILNLVVSRDYFASLDVEKTFKSAETELRDIIYEPENHSDLYKYLKNKYDMPDNTTCRIRVSYSSYTIYGVTIQMKSSEKSVQIRSTILKN
jgi:putative lipoprotein